MKKLIVIPARGGSKRFPGKNITLFNQVSLIEHTIIYALKNAGANEIVVTTDNVEIKNIALKYGIMTVDRPIELSTDLSTTVSALKHVLEVLDENHEIVVLLQATNPLRPKNLFHQALYKFLNYDCDSLMTVSRNRDKLGKIINGKFLPFNYEQGQRSQDLEPLFYENGLLYISKASLILEHPYAKVDIDNKEDLMYANFVLNTYPDEN